MVHHCREDALSDRDYERLVAATHQLDDDYHALETRLIVLVCGRLGLRAGELTHLRADWLITASTVAFLSAVRKRNDRAEARAYCSRSC